MTPRGSASSGGNSGEGSSPAPPPQPAPSPGDTGLIGALAAAAAAAARDGAAALASAVEAASEKAAGAEHEAKRLTGETRSTARDFRSKPEVPESGRAADKLTDLKRELEGSDGLEETIGRSQAGLARARSCLSATDLQELESCQGGVPGALAGLKTAARYAQGVGETLKGDKDLRQVRKTLERHCGDRRPGSSKCWGIGRLNSYVSTAQGTASGIRDELDGAADAWADTDAGGKKAAALAKRAAGLRVQIDELRAAIEAAGVPLRPGGMPMIDAIGEAERAFTEAERAYAEASAGRGDSTAAAARGNQAAARGALALNRLLTLLEPLLEPDP
ncbi:MAG: hypothetical protein HY613_07360 [Candidatus Rokubacteria bacterium]|nr:hypothetical protein [Candidatus Rokubacteria bacterium]